MNHITDEQVMATLREVVAERPDYVYKRPEHMRPLVGSHDDVTAECFYVHTSPSDVDDLTLGCLVGTVLSQCGVSLEDLRRREGWGAFEVATDFGVDEDMASFLGAVQHFQDSGKPWAMALSAAAEDYPEVVSA